MSARVVALVTAFLTAGALSTIASAAGESSLFAQLVDATEQSDRGRVARLLATKTLSASSGDIGTDGRPIGGTLRHGVPVSEVAARLEGCTVSRWRDVGNLPTDAFILWECPGKRVRSNACYFYTYRAALLDARYHPPNLFFGEMLSWDVRCGARGPLPPPR